MENWDESKLEEVVNKKHGEAEKKKAKTQIVSWLGWGRMKSGGGGGHHVVFKHR